MRLYAVMELGALFSKAGIFCLKHRRSGSPCAGNARKKKVYEAHVNPDWLNEWPALTAKSHKGDTDAFCRLCRCDFSVSSGESKTYSVTSLIITRCHH